MLDPLSLLNTGDVVSVERVSIAAISQIVQCCCCDCRANSNIIDLEQTWQTHNLEAIPIHIKSVRGVINLKLKARGANDDAMSTINLGLQLLIRGGPHKLKTTVG